MDPALAIANLTSPPVLFFALGVAAALARSDLAIPEAIAKAMSLYLMLAIGFKGGASAAENGLGWDLLLLLTVAVILSFAIPFMAYQFLRTTRLDQVNRAAVAAHYGSISIVTFVAAIGVLESSALAYPGIMIAAAAAMEVPAIISALFLARRGGGTAAAGQGEFGTPWREILLNGSIVLLLGAFIIGTMTGEKGYVEIAPFIDDPFKGVLCLFLLDMGLVAGRELRQVRGVLSPALISFGIYMPLISAALGLAAGLLIGLDAGGLALLAVLSASASYIAVPAAMRLALPEAKPSIYLTLSLAITFPFNLAIGIPIYLAAANWLA